MAAILCLTMAPLSVTPAMAQPTISGNIIDNSGLIPFQQAFFAFEVESALGSLKDVAIWDELEQMLDNPYQFAPDPSVPGNEQGYPSFRLTQERRRSFIYRNAAGEPCAPLSAGCNEVPLPRHIIHPLNYNHMNGEELRLLNIDYEGGAWQVPYQLVQTSPGDPGATPPVPASYAFTYRPIDVSPGEGRVEDDEAAIDFNSPMAPDTPFTITAVDSFFYPGPHPWGSTPTGEGALITGADPGEPGYLGFGVLGNNTPARRRQYSTPAVPGIASHATPIPTTARLFDPTRGLIQPRNAGGAGGLRKPSLRVPPNGTPSNPLYTRNSAANLAADPAALLPSNENDYYAGGTGNVTQQRAQKVAARAAAAALGKSLFWDMQVGSDTVQACASCHFHAGADNRTKNQTNPNHLGGDLILQLHGGVQNTDLVATDFPFHPGGQDTFGSGNDINDVSSSMGVRFRRFVDIPPIGTLGPPDAFGVSTLLPDIGDDPLGGQSADPIPLFQGLRRVEPRNTPTFFNSAINFDNFWDGRARHDFNGGSVFGASDPQSHVMVDQGGTIVPTRQIIRFASLASLTTGPALSDFEMSFQGRNWAKLGKKLLQAGVTPLANQLVSTDDSVMGLYSNQGGSACAALPAADRSPGATAAGKPGLCINYPGLIKRAFFPALWSNTGQHLNGCYTSDPLGLHSPAELCVAGSVAIPVLQDTDADGNGDVVVGSPTDPFDNYVLTPASGPAGANNTSQFTQMEANMSLFAGLSVHAWGLLLVPDDTPLDRFMDANPDTFASFGESGEPTLALDLPNCFGPNGTGGVQPCFVEVGNFKRDPGVVARINCPPENPAGCTDVPAGGTRTVNDTVVDPLMGLDFFLGSNLSLKNRNFRSLRCGECHAGGTLTDATFGVSHQTSFIDFVQEFFTGQPGSEKFPEPLGRDRVISGFSLEGELNENAQDAIERNVLDFCTVTPCSIPATDAFGNVVSQRPEGGFPQGMGMLDNGMYNLGVTPIGNDISRGGNDPFGWPLSLARLALKNLGGVDYSPGGHLATNGFAQPATPGNPLPTFTPTATGTGADYFIDASGGLFDPTAQDQQINYGYGEEPNNPLLPPHLAPWASNIPVGDESNQDELFFGLNTLMREPMLEGFVDAWGPFNPAAVIGEAFNNARQPEMAAWPNVNRVNSQGAFKAAPLRHVARTAPYFHNGGRLTLRQQLDFYMKGGDFPLSNSAHRDFLIMNLDLEDEALGGCIVTATGRPVPPDLTTGICPAGSAPEFTETQKEGIRVAIIDFLLELTDERVDFQRAPFDQPEIFVPLDGKAPDNGLLAGAVVAGRQGFLNNTAGECDATDLSAGACFRQVPVTGAAGVGTPTPNFLGVTDGPRLVGSAANCGAAPTNHYCH
jgi:cytochrome c peroxidase